MTNPQQKPAPTGRVWTAPRLQRIGTIADVAGSQGTGPQGSGAKT